MEHWGGTSRPITTVSPDGSPSVRSKLDYARPYYRHVHVSDLELVTYRPGFKSHIRFVCRCFRAFAASLGASWTPVGNCFLPTGQLLISVPNAGYCGLVAELMQGEFLYREEGLLDKTHLRFFTRRSLQRFLRRAWLGALKRSIPFNELPESDSRHASTICLPVARYMHRDT